MPTWRGRIIPTAVAAVALVATAAAIAPPGAGAQAIAPPGASTQATPVSEGGAAASRQVRQLCRAAEPGMVRCFAIRASSAPIQPATTQAAEAAEAVPKGFGPADLRSAYALPADGGAGQTIAVVASYDAPSAEADLAVYRAKFGLPPCTTANGCFRKVDQRGGDAYPTADYGWAAEIALDLDMVSAVAPRAKIILVEADTAYVSDLAVAVDEAVALGARFVSNSYGTTLYAAFSGFAEHFDHSGVAIIAASGDSGLSAAYPAGSEKVVSVGGTSLVKDDSARGWSERVWNSVGVDGNGARRWGATGSGCATSVSKPKFQADTGCKGRSIADVSAVADPNTGVAVYNSYSDNGWSVYGGTSASAPIIAGIYALAGEPIPGTYPNSYPYRSPQDLYDVTTGNNASCPSGLCSFPTTPTCQPTYICVAGPGYDGPTGLGTPNGLAAFRGGPHGTVTGRVTDATTGAPISGVSLDLGLYQTTTADDGRYRLTVPAASYQLVVAGYGYTTATLGDVAVPNGSDVVEDITLVALPAQFVTGQVREDGGHDWPLYAKITIDGIPGGPIFTDPVTGVFRLKLQFGATYTLKVTAINPGYQPVAVTVPIAAVTSAQSPETCPPTALQVRVPVDQAHPDAPGYALTYHGGEIQRFHEPVPPKGWQVKNHTDLGGWEFDDPLGRGNSTGGGGGFAILDGFHLGWDSIDSELISPSYDFSKETKPEVSFDTFVARHEEGETPSRNLDVSVDDGASWTTVWNGPKTLDIADHITVPLTAYAGQRRVRVRFHYVVPGLGGIWEIDDVAVGTRDFAAIPGGLIAGQITDANTGNGITGATVLTGGPSSRPRQPAGTGNSWTAAGSTTTTGTPADPALGDGWFWLFTPKIGLQEITADRAAINYPAITSKIVVWHGVTRANLALRAGRITVAGSGLKVTLTRGERRTATVTIRNTGSATARFTVGEQAAPVIGGTPDPAVSDLALPTRRVPAAALPARLDATGWHPATVRAVGASTPSETTPGAYMPFETAPAASAPAGTGWRKITEAPVAAAYGLGAVSQGRLYFGWGDVNQALFSNDFMRYDPLTRGWTRLASPVYRRYSPSGAFINGRFYVSGGRNGLGQTIPDTESYDPATDTWTTVARMPIGYGSSGSAVLNGKLYLVGGCRLGDSGFGDACGSHDVQVYDPASNTWTSAGAYPLAISSPSCGTIGERIYCAGGAEYEDSTADAFSYDPVANTWARIARLPLDLLGSAHAVANGRLVVTTGYSTTTEAVTNEGYSYDPGTNTWSALPSTQRAGAYSVGAPGFYLIGGVRLVDEPVADTQMSGEVDLLAGWDQPYDDLPWLSVHVPTSVLAPGQATKIVVRLEPGPATLDRYVAAIAFASDTPYPVPSVSVVVTISEG